MAFKKIKTPKDKNLTQEHNEITVGRQNTYYRSHDIRNLQTYGFPLFRQHFHETSASAAQFLEGNGSSSSGRETVALETNATKPRGDFQLFTNIVLQTPADLSHHSNGKICCAK